MKVPSYRLCPYYVLLMHQLLLLAPLVSSFSPVLSKTSSHIQYRKLSHLKIKLMSRRSNNKLFMANNNMLDSLTSLFPSLSSPNKLQLVPPSKINDPSIVVTNLVEALNQGNVENALALVSDHFLWDDTSFYKTCNGKEEFERRLRLLCECTTVQKYAWKVDNTAIDTVRSTVGVLFHKEDKKSGATLDRSRGCALFQVDSSTNLVTDVCVVGEPDTKGGEGGLKILSGASKIMSKTGYNPEAQKQEGKRNASLQYSDLSPAERYFAGWNSRDLDAAVAVFTEDIAYEDTAFPYPFTGKDNLLSHLKKCADAFPSTFTFEVDNLAVDKNTMAVAWHVENDGEALPFTQGCSFYKVDKSGKIQQGIDFVEPAVIKQGGASMFLNSLQTKLSQEPVRWIAAISWVAYMYIVFFSDGILPGANALQLEERTWEEVLNLSLNFFLVSPLLKLPFSPSIHPMLEGVFNLLLSWAAMFAGFLSDDRRQKPNLIPFFPIVIGMQFLTSAFLLPYLATRSSESENTRVVAKDELSTPARVAGESRILPLLMTLVGTASIFWFFFGRMEDYGSDFAARFASFTDLLSVDRVGSSFLVDLAIFALFQGWFIDDDLKRRGVGDGGTLGAAAKYIPFFGMAAYLFLRPELPDEKSQER